jgi:hypothetical protein
MQCKMKRRIKCIQAEPEADCILSRVLKGPSACYNVIMDMYYNDIAMIKYFIIVYLNFFESPGCNHH